MEKTMGDLDKISEVCNRVSERKAFKHRVDNSALKEIKKYYSNVEANNNRMRPADFKLKIKNLRERLEKSFRWGYKDLFEEEYINVIIKLLEEKKDLIDKEKSKEIMDFVAELRYFLDTNRYNFDIDNLYVDYLEKSDNILLWLKNPR